MNSEIEVMQSIKEKTADEMFEELGYIRTKANEYWIIYRNFRKDIDFNLKHKTIEVESGKESEEFDIQELQAINKKCKEMNWI